MKEYIEKDALIKTTEETPFTMSMFLNRDQCDGANMARHTFATIFKILPAADVVEVQDALAFSQTFNLDEYRGKEDQRDCDFVFGVLMRLGIVCLKMYDPTTRTMKLWVEKVDGGVNDDDN